MADTTALKNRIRAAIKANDNQEITGPVLQQTLLDMVDEFNGATETEANARQNGDNTLQQGINAERQRITEEIQRAQGAEQTIDGKASKALHNIDNLEIEDVTGSQSQVTEMSIALRTNEGSEQDPEIVTLDTLTIEQATDQKAGLLPAKNQWDTQPVFKSNKILKSGGVFNSLHKNIELSNPVESIYVTSSGNPSRLAFSNQSSSKYYLVNLSDLGNPDKVYITTHRVSGTFNNICQFTGDNDIILGYANFEDSSTEAVLYEVNVPDGATRIYINNAISSPNAWIALSKDFIGDINILKKAERNLQNSVSSLNAQVSSIQENKLDKIVYTDIPSEIIIGEENKYAVSSGNPPRMAFSNQSASKYISFELSSVGNPDKIAVTTTRVSASLNAILFFSDNNNLAVDYITLVDSDVVENLIVNIPATATKVWVNCLKTASNLKVTTVVDVYNELQKTSSEVKDKLDKVIKVEPSITTISSVFITGSGNPEKIVYSNQSTCKYALITVKELNYPSKIYVTTSKPGPFDLLVGFADDNDYVLGWVMLPDGETSVVDYEVSVPKGATKIFINDGISAPDPIVYSYVNVIDNLADIQEEILSAGVDGIDSIANTYKDNFKGVSAIRCYGSRPIYNITAFGYDSTTNQFKVQITSGNVVLNGVRDFTSRPSSGKNTLGFIMQSQDFHYIEIDLDWSGYSGSYFEVSQGDKIIVDTNPIANLHTIKGRIDVYGDILYYIHNHLYGEDCTLHIHDTARFVLYSNSSFNDINFIDVSENASPARQEYTAEQIAEDERLRYIYVPVVTEADLSSEDSNIIYGISDYGFIRFQGQAVNSHITGCTFSNFGRVAVADEGQRHLNPKHNYINGCLFENCRCGIVTYGEFSRHNGNYFFGCVIGMVIAASNYNANNCNFVRCDCGVYFTSTQNAHGEFSTFEFAHNGVAGVYAKTINNDVGFIISNSQFAQAPIIAEVAYALKLSSCRLDCYIKISAGAKNSIIGNNVGNGYYAELPVYNVPQDTLITLNRAMKSSESDDLYNNI